MLDMMNAVVDQVNCYKSTTHLETLLRGDMHVYKMKCWESVVPKCTWVSAMIFASSLISFFLQSELFCPFISLLVNSGPDGKNTHYAKYVCCSSMIAPRISGGVWHNMVSERKGILAHITGDTSPKSSTSWPNKSERSTKSEKLAKRGQKIVWLGKGQNIFLELS